MTNNYLMIRTVTFFEDNPEFVKVQSVDYVFFDDRSPAEVVRVRQKILDEMLKRRGKLQVAVWKSPTIPVTQKTLGVINPELGAS